VVHHNDAYHKQYPITQEHAEQVSLSNYAYSYSVLAYAGLSLENGRPNAEG